MKSKFADIDASALSAYVTKNLSLAFPPERHDDLLRRVEAAGRGLGFMRLREFVDALTTPPAPAHIDSLAEQLTVPETYFWREPEMFDALTTSIIPELLDTKKEKFLRIWSAGCSNGEEPYSIAIALLRSIPDIRHWNVRIDATDVNPRALAAACAGMYGNWSFRNAPPWLHEYFTKVAARKWRIDPRVRGMVRFSYGNLAHASALPLGMDHGAYDIIFCRNVMMYFPRDVVSDLVARFHRCLSETGFFIVSASELSFTMFRMFEPVTSGNAHYYRKTPFTESAATPDTPAAAEESRGARRRVPPAPRAGTPAVIAAAERPSDAGDGASVPRASIEEYARVRALADKGQLEQALELCGELLMRDDTDPAVQYLLAVILHEKGREAEAIEALKRTLYLDNTFVLAHFLRARILQRTGHVAAARKSFRNVLELLGTTDGGDIVPHSDGLHVGRLRETVIRAMETGGDS